MRRDYELGFILNPEVSEEQIRATVERIEQIVANHDGQIVKVNNWGRRRLAYPIERHRDGFYIFIDMILTPETISEVERSLQVSEIVLRFMSKRRDPKAAQKEREEREEREARAAAAAAAAAEAASAEAERASESAETPESTETPEEVPAVTEEVVTEVPEASETTEATPESSEATTESSESIEA